MSNSLRELLVFIGSYCGVWTLVGIALYAVYPLYRAYGPVAAGTVAIAAGMYELTPLKQRLRRRCLETFGSGVQFGLCCVGSSIGLMLLMLAVDLMSITWMLVLAVLMLTQKVLPAKAVIDVPLAFAMVGLGILMVVPPGSIPGVMPLL